MKDICECLLRGQLFVAVGISHIVRAAGGVEGLTDIVEQLELLGIVAEPIYQQ